MRTSSSPVVAWTYGPGESASSSSRLRFCRAGERLRPAAVEHVSRDAHRNAPTSRAGGVAKRPDLRGAISHRSPPHARFTEARSRARMVRRDHAELDRARSGRTVRERRADHLQLRRHTSRRDPRCAPATPGEPDCDRTTLSGRLGLSSSSRMESHSRGTSHVSESPSRSSHLRPGSNRSTRSTQSGGRCSRPVDPSASSRRRAVRVSSQRVRVVGSQNVGHHHLGEDSRPARCAGRLRIRSLAHQTLAGTPLARRVLGRSLELDRGRLAAPEFPTALCLGVDLGPE